MNETKLDGQSKDIISDNISKLKKIFPEVITENKIDFEKLQSILGKDIDVSREKYSFTWPGKTQAIKESQKQSTGTLRPCKEESKNWDTTQNLYIEGDNLEVLKLLQKGYYNKIKMIYIDPPYNTGNDFIYPDNYTDNLDYYLKISGQVLDSEGERESIGIKLTNNPETAGRYHSNWLNMMYPRLKLARNLLSDNGVIYISIGDDEFSNLKNICDEIFGEINFIASFVRISKKGSSMGKFVSPSYDLMLCYVKNIDLNEGFVFPQTKEYISQFNEEDGKGKYKTKSLYQSSLDPLRGCNNQRYFVKCPDGSLAIPPGEVMPKNKEDAEKIVPKTRNDKVWRWSVETYLKEKDNLVFKKSKNSPLIDEYGNKSQWNISTKQYLKGPEESKVVPGNLIENSLNSEATSELKRINIPFDFAKPVSLIKYLAQVCNTKEKDIILDFFSGSATSAESIISLNSVDNYKRRFIMIQIPEEVDEKILGNYKTICEIGKERIRRAGDKILEESNNKDLDIGFKVFKLDSSNLEKWDPDYNNLQQSLTIDNIKEGRTNEDLVYEIMLKYGIDLTYPIEQMDNIYSIGFGALIICLDNNITKDITNQILKLTNNSSTSRVVFKDSGFKSDADKTNIKEILKTNNIDEFITI